MEGSRLIQKLTLRNILSYGPDGEEMELLPLNVLIGPNASGKSNFIDALSLLGAAPRDLAAPIRQGGGIGEWICKGADDGAAAEIEAIVSYPDAEVPWAEASAALRHRMLLGNVRDRAEVREEEIELIAVRGKRTYPPLSVYSYEPTRAILAVRERIDAPEDPELGRKIRLIPTDELKRDQSILSQWRDPQRFPELTCLADQFARISIHREWCFGRRAPGRRAEQADLPDDFLLDPVTNLGLVLNDLEHQPGARGLVLEKLRAFWEDVEAISTKVHVNTVQIFLHEKNGKQIPATRLSDGTLRYLCLLAILCHPEPPPLICLEEPELGMHPDILPAIAELLVEASQRTQLIVTTHSDILVSALTETPEAVIVCERDDGGSHLRRLEPERLKAWLEKYSLGDLWLRGELGGTRW